MKIQRFISAIVCRLTALLLAAYSLASDQRAHLAAAALLQLRSLCSSSQPPAAASHPAAEQADDSVGEAGPAGPGLQLPACWHLQRQAAACALLHMAHGLLLPGSGAVPAQLATAVQRILEVVSRRPLTDPLVLLPRSCSGWFSVGMREAQK